MKKDITCIVCPRGCQMVVTNVDGEFKVEGNTCNRGAKYGVNEVTNPQRVVTSTVKLQDSYLNMIPVKTQGAVPKDMVLDVMKVLSDITVTAPVKVGDVIVKNILDTGIDIVSAKTMENINDVLEDENLREAL